MEINEICQNAVIKQQNHDQTVSVDSVNFGLFHKVADDKADTDTRNVAASSVEELDGLCTYELIRFLVDYLAVLASVTVGNACHVDIRVDISPDHTT